jgi:hypothetical protein
MIRRLCPEELARTPVCALHEHGRAPERARAAAIIAGLRDFMQGELALSGAQVDDLALALERALMLSLRAAP